MIPSDEIAKMKARCAAATAEPWSWRDVAGAGIQLQAVVGLTDFVEARFQPGVKYTIYTLRAIPEPIRFGDALWVQFEPQGWSALQQANAEFITRARTDLPRVIADNEQMSAVFAAAATRPWWLNNFADKHDRDYRVCLGCRREWYADYKGKREHGVLCSFAVIDAAVDAAEGGPS